MRNLKLLSGLFVFAVFLAGSSVVYGGLSWTGMDPVVKLSDGRIVNVELAVPPDAWCSIQGPVKVRIKAPSGSALVAEQLGPCGVTTSTKPTERDDDSISVKVYRLKKGKAPRLPLEVMISVDGEEQATCAGNTKRGVSCSIDLPDDDDDDHDDRGDDGSDDDSDSDDDDDSDDD